MANEKGPPEPKRRAFPHVLHAPVWVFGACNAARNRKEPTVSLMKIPNRSQFSIASLEDAIYRVRNGPKRKLAEGLRGEKGGMVLLSAAVAAALATPPAVTVRERARASVTVLQPFRASPQTWNPTARPNQREVVRRQADGMEVRLRLTEFE